jgi:uncharacterized protein
VADPPRLGVGLGYRGPLHADILRHLPEVGFLEVISDNFFRNERALQALASLVPCIPHALNLSVGSTVDEAYLAKVQRIVRMLDPPWHTDHLAFTRERGLAIGHLAPVPYTDESLALVVANVQRVQAALGGRFGIENITMPFYWPNDTMEEHDFLREVVRRTGCWLLLDLENARCNAANHGGEARRFLDALPLERVVQVHIAGGVHDGPYEHDTHSAPVSEATWELLRYLCDVAPPPAVLLERDGDFPAFGDIVAELRRARATLEKAA